MSEGWYFLLAVDFLLAFGCFLVLLYRGVLKAIASPLFFSWDRFMNLLWTFLATFVIGQTLFTGDIGGFRTAMATVVILAQWYVLLFRSPYLPEDLVVEEK